jgi:hypothetical protein
MNNPNYSIRCFKARAFMIVAFLSLFFVANGSAQTNTPEININVSILPPYSPYYADYSGPNAGKVLLIIQNLTATQKTVKLVGQLTGDNGIKISTKSTYVPLQPIVLNPNETKQLNGVALKDIFDLNSLNVYGIDKSKLIYTSRLPEGNYTFCIQAVALNTNQVVSSTAPLGCTSISITYPEAPVNISPSKSMPALVTVPQSVIFNWINPGVVPPIIQYLFQVAEMPTAGADPNQVLNSTSFPLINKTVMGTSYLLNAADPPLIAGKYYAWRVQAIDPTGQIMFKNEGRSAALSFLYGKPVAQFASTGELKLYPINPGKENEQLTVTEKNPLNFGWILANASQMPVPKQTIVIDTTLYKQVGIKKYFVIVTRKNAAINEAPVLFTSLINEADQRLSHNFKKSKKEAQALGFKDKEPYLFEVQGLDANNKAVLKSVPISFVFNYAEDPEQKFYVQVKTQLKYSFEGKPGIYPVAKTPVTVTVTATANRGFYPIKTYLEGSAETDANGNLKLVVAIAEKYKDWNLDASMTIANAYYGSKTLKRIPMPDFKSDTNFVDLGEQFAEVYGYGLKLYVQKEFPVFKVDQQGKSWLAGNSTQKSEFAYDEKGNIVYQVAAKEYQAGVPIRLYRKGKQAYIPPGEGTIIKLGLVGKEQDVLVAEGKTQVETVAGVTKSFVKFEKLLANFYEGDEYYALAIDATNIKQTTAHGSSKYTIASISQATLGDGYTATEKTIKFIPKKGSTYSEFQDTYTILSNRPPQSLVSGRIVYKWAGNKDNIARAYANQKFHIEVGYRFKPKDGDAAYVGTSYDAKSGEENYFVKQTDGKDGELFLLRDAGIIAGSGTTDSTGRFTIQIDNLGYKGALGSGSISRSNNPFDNLDKENEKQYPKPSLESILGLYGQGMEDPTWGQLLANSKASLVTLPNEVQTVISTNTNLTAALTGADLSPSAITAGKFTVNAMGNTAAKKVGAKGMKSGPSDGFADHQDDESDGVMERVFIVVPENYHLIEAQEPLIVQPFEAKEGGQFTAIVWETKLTVAVKSPNNQPLRAMKVTVFRTKEQKLLNMPLGEGDNQYRTAKLINPQLKKVNNVKMASGGLAVNGIYDQEFEKLWEGTTGDDGTFAAPQLFIGVDYYLQVTSDPTNGADTYESYIQYVDRMYVAESKINVTLNPLPTRIAGKLTEAGESGLPIKWGLVYFNNDPYLHAISDKEGYFEVFGNNANLKFPVKEIKIIADGYTDFSQKINVTSKVGEQLYNNYPLQLGEMAQGYVANRDLKDLITSVPVAVQSYVRRSNGAMVLTDKNGYYKIAIKSVPNGQSLEKLEIIPLDVAFFRETITAHRLAASINGKKLYDMVVPRHHRMDFYVDRAGAHGAAANLPNINVQVEEFKRVSDLNGKASFNFPNVAVNNYSVVLTPVDPKDDWIPQVYNVSNEETKEPVSYYVTMKAGNTIKGKVTLDGAPVGNAKVYLEYKEGSNGLLTSNATLIQTKSNKDGSFVLRGVPIDPSKAFVIATLDTSFTVTGNRQPAYKNAQDPVLTLTSLKGLLVKSVHGFPLAVEELKPAYLNDQFLVTGIVDLSKGSSQFKLNDKDATVRVRDVIYKREGNFLVPVNPEVKIEGTTNLVMKYLDRYNVKINKQGAATSELTIFKNANGQGEIRGLTKIVDNSFNYPGSYLNFTAGEDFYLADAINASSVNPVIAGMTAYTSDQVYLNSIQQKTFIFYKPISKSFQVSNANGNPIKFKFIDFNATANPLNSYIATDGKIHLNVKLDCTLPDAQPSSFTVDLKDVVIDNNKVYPGAGAPIELMLEKWKLVVNNWTFDPEKGGILSNTAVIKTSKLDIPIGFFNLRSDMMVFKNINANNLTLGGGIKKLENVDTENAVLIYDTKTGADMLPHWRMSVAGSGGKPAAKLNLDGLGNLDVSYVQVLSNDESILSLAPIANPLTIQANKRTAFTPQTITNGPDFFEVNGSLDLKAPRMSPFALNIAYTKTGQKFRPVTTAFEGKGYVHFIANNQPISITKDAVSFKGVLQEKPNQSFDLINGTFLGDATGFKVSVTPDTVINLSANGNQKFKITSGGMKVENQDWSIFSFNGSLVTKGNIQENQMTFNVYGDVQVDGKEIKTSTPTPFGAFKMVYDFKKQTLFGSLNVPEKDFGAYKLAGNVEMLIGPNGFYFLGSGKLNTAVPIVGGGYSVGFLISDYKEGTKSIPQATWNTLQAFQLNKNDCFYKSYQNDFKGIYLTAGRSLIDYQKDFDFVIVAGYVEAKAAAELSIWGNFGKDTSFGAAISATGRMRAGMSAITGTSMAGGFTAEGAIQFGYATKTGFNVDATLNAGFEAHVSQSLLFTTIKLAKAVAARLRFGTSGYGIDLTSGAAKIDCPSK